MRCCRPVLSLTIGVATSFGLVACAGQPAPATAADDSGDDDWLVVSFEDRPAEFDGSAMDLLLDTELRADQVLSEAGVGFLDGNEIGDYGYELWFSGPDAREIWRVLEPVFADAPLAWSRVTLMDAIDDESPEVLTPSGVS